MVKTPKVFPAVKYQIPSERLIIFLSDFSLACICQEARIPADRQHKQVQAERLLHASQSWEGPGSIGLEARDSLSQSPIGVSLHCCGSQANPSQRGARRSCRNCVLGSVQKLWLFVC